MCPPKEFVRSYLSKTLKDFWMGKQIDLVKKQKFKTEIPLKTRCIEKKKQRTRQILIVTRSIVDIY